MRRCTVKVLNRAGIHARPASLLVQKSQNFKCDIWIEKDDAKANAKSILNILALGATYSTKLRITAEGEDEELAVEEIASLFERKFQE